MKTIFAATNIFALTGLAQEATPAPSSHAQNILSQIEAAQAQYQAENGGANFDLVRGLMKGDVGMLNGYGCWCYFEDDHGQGRGQPVDDVDKMCKTLHDGYTCLMMDTDNLDEPCIPWDTDYTSAIGVSLSGMSMEAIQMQCRIKNDNDTCKSSVCMVEGWFIQSYFLFSVNGGALDAAHGHENGFNPKDDCPIRQGEASEKACCGDYPARFPYKIQDGTRGCCQGRTFNSEIYQCCDNGKVKMEC